MFSTTCASSAHLWNGDSYFYEKDKVNAGTTLQNKILNEETRQRTGDVVEANKDQCKKK